VGGARNWTIAGRFRISDVLTDPTLELRAANGTLLFQNDNWQTILCQAANSQPWVSRRRIQTNRARRHLQPGAYTAILAGRIRRVV